MSSGEASPASFFGERLKDEAMLRSFLLWRRLWLAGRTTPSWNRFEPGQLPDLLTQLEIHERVAAGRFMSRQAWSSGTERIARGAGRLHFDERVGPRHLAARLRVFEACLEAGLPVAYRDFLFAPDSEPRMFRRLLLPFRDDAERPNLLLSHVVAAGLPRGTPPDPRSEEVVYCRIEDLVV